MVALFVILTFLAFLTVDYFVHRKQYRTPSTTALTPTSVRLPRGFFFSRGHMWVQLLFSGKARIGLDDFVQKVIGHIDAIVTPSIGSEIERGEPLITVRQNGRSIVLTAPISGRVSEINPIIDRLPKFLQADPYSEGWFIAVEPRFLTQEIPKLFIADNAAKWLKDEINRFRDFIQIRSTEKALSAAGLTMLDGGLPVAGVLENADESIWQAFSNEFLAENRRTPDAK